jgi:hypothetical protein
MLNEIDIQIIQRRREDLFREAKQERLMNRAAKPKHGGIMLLFVLVLAVFEGWLSGVRNIRRAPSG